MLFQGKEARQSPPLVWKGLYRSFADSYRLLYIVPCHDPTIATKSEDASSSASSQSDEALKESESHLIRPCFYVWKPRTAYKKSAPGPSDFRVAVVDARESPFHTLQQLHDLLQSVPYSPPPASMKRQHMHKLKHSYRNAILATVDQGVVSYMRVADEGFCKESCTIGWDEVVSVVDDHGCPAPNQVEHLVS